MEITDEIREAHAVLSPYNLEFLEYVRKNPECQERSSFALLDRRDDLVQFPLQAWPTFVEKPFQQQISRAAVGITRLVKSIPDRFFGGDPRELARYYAVEERHGAILLELLKLGDHVDGLINRHDFIYGDSGFKCLECNMTSYLGGWNAGIFAQWYQKIPVLQGFFSTLPKELVYTDIPRNFLRHVFGRAQARLPTAEAIRIAFVIPPGERPTHKAMEFACSKLQEIADEGDRKIEVGVEVCDYADFREGPQGMLLGGKKVDVVIENQNGLVSREVFRNLFMGTLDVYNGPLTTVFNDKRNLALLSEALGTERLSPEEKGLVEELIPWTRELRAGETDFGGERVELADFVDSRRGDLVIKPARAAHGEQVYLGSRTGAADWSAAVRNALESDDPWIVQEHVESRPFLFQRGPHGAESHDLVWGFFVFGERYAGTLLRMLPKQGAGIVNAARGAEEGAIIEIAES